MKALRAKELVGQDPDKLNEQLKKLEEDLFKNRLKQMTNQLENTMLIRNARRDIARIKTVLAAQGGAEAQTAAVKEEGNK